jgi:hypothetical protein
LPFVYPSNKYVCARCWKQTNDMAYVQIYFPDNRPFEYVPYGEKSVTQTHKIEILCCYDHIEEVVNYLIGRERKLKRLYPVDMKQKDLFQTGLFK